MLYKEQPKDIRKEIVERPEPIPSVDGDEYIVEKILNHRKKGKGYQFLTLWKGYPEHDATWQKTSDFIDSSGNKNGIWQEYISDIGILPQHQ